MRIWRKITKCFTGDLCDEFFSIKFYVRKHTFHVTRIISIVSHCHIANWIGPSILPVWNRYYSLLRLLFISILLLKLLLIVLIFWRMNNLDLTTFKDVVKFLNLWCNGFQSFHYVGRRRLLIFNDHWTLVHSFCFNR